MKFAKIITTVALVCATATPAMAWGDREQGALVGIGALLLGQQLINQNQQQYAPQPQYQYQQPQPQYQYQQPQPQYQEHRHHRWHHWRRQSSTSMDICDYSGQRVRVYDEYGRVIGFRYC